jgi:hypothetical protein
LVIDRFGDDDSLVEKYNWFLLFNKDGRVIESAKSSNIGIGNTNETKW